MVKIIEIIACHMAQDYLQIQICGIFFHVNVSRYFLDILHFKYQHLTCLDEPLLVVFCLVVLGAIQVLRNADGGGGCQFFWGKALRRCKVQCY